MLRLLKNKPSHVRNRLRQRPYWPVALLAPLLGCSPRALYKRIKRGDLGLIGGEVPAEDVLELCKEVFLSDE